MSGGPTIQSQPPVNLTHVVEFYYQALLDGEVSLIEEVCLDGPTTVTRTNTYSDGAVIEYLVPFTDNGRTRPDPHRSPSAPSRVQIPGNSLYARRCMAVPEQSRVATPSPANEANRSLLERAQASPRRMVESFFAPTNSDLLRHVGHPAQAQRGDSGRVTFPLASTVFLPTESELEGIRSVMFVCLTELVVDIHRATEMKSLWGVRRRNALEAHPVFEVGREAYRLLIKLREAVVMSYEKEQRDIEAAKARTPGSGVRRRLQLDTE